MSQFFISRPVFAWVIAILIMLAGAMSISKLPVEQYPDIAPPSVSISATYPGASATVVENSVTQVIEQNMKGLDGLLYMSASSQNNGSASVTLTFENGVDPDIAQVQVQNKLQLAMPRLPQQVQDQGVRVTKANSGFLMVLGFYSEDGSMQATDIADYVSSNLVDSMSRLEGVGNVRVFGSKYAMRIWLDPNAMAHYAVSTEEITQAIRSQNAQISLGELGGTPNEGYRGINATITANGRLQTPEQFSNIIVRAKGENEDLRLADVARVELGAESYDFVTKYNGQPASGVAISLATGANAMATADAVKGYLDDISGQLPTGLKVVTAYDTTPFIAVSIEGVVHTLIEAVVLVFLVMYLFLQNFRATLIPTIAVPVVLLGTFGLLATLGFSINMLTMFAMVLAIGLLVDDAIVVVENVERIMHEKGLSALEATRESMGQISGALVGIGLVLSAVFVPMAFLGGATGVIYQQFSATIVSAMTLSVLVALILTPALCATMLRQEDVTNKKTTGFFAWFNRTFDAGAHRYERSVGGILKRPKRTLGIFAALLVAMGWLYTHLPSAFLPEEDQGILLTQVVTPSGSTQVETLEALKQVEDHFLTKEEDVVASVFSVQGFSFAGSGQNTGMAFVRLKDWSEREAPGQSAQAIAGRSMGFLMTLKNAQAFAFAPPAIPALGVSQGFSMYLKDIGGNGREALMEAQGQLLALAGADERLAKVRPNGLPDKTQLHVDIDYERAASLGVSPSSINTAMSTAWGGQYIDDFMDRGKVKRVYMQAEIEGRMSTDDFSQWEIPNDGGHVVNMRDFITLSWEKGAPKLARYNGSPSVEIQGEPAPGVSSGEAMIAMEQLVEQLPPGFALDWTGMSYQEREAGNQVYVLYLLSVLIVFLCLAALYESWSIPTAVLMVAPLGILGTLLAAFVRDMSQDVFFQVAMLTTVGLTSKNAILIVEFAKENVEKGVEITEATMMAVRDRIRPIIMTSLAFGLGVLPLALATGAGAGSQNAIGTGVLGGMLLGTFLGVFFIPLFYVVIQKLFGSKVYTVISYSKPSESSEKKPSSGLDSTDHKI